MIHYIESLGPKRCANAQDSEMTKMHELRLVAQASIKSWSQGYYQESGDVVSDECFGEWMHDSFSKIKDFVKMWKEDPLAVPLEEYYAISREVVDLLVKNKDTCQINKQVNDFNAWCTDNEETCLLGEGLEQRIVENSVDIASTVLDIFHILEKDDTCYTAKEQLDEYSRFIKDFGELHAATSGFDLKWDQTQESRHIKRSAFRTTVKTFYHRKHMTFKQIMELDFPELSQILEDLFKALHHFRHLIANEFKQVVNDFVHGVVAVDKEMTAFLMPVHHKTQHHAPQHHSMTHHMPTFAPFEMPSFGAMNLFPMPQPMHHNYPKLNFGGLF